MKKLWIRKTMMLSLAMLLLGTTLVGCDEEVAPVQDEFGISGGELDENGKPVFGTTGWEEPAGKADALLGRPGLSTSVDGDSLSVWSVKNDWADTDTDAAREAGLAWGEDSGLTWDEKYIAWVNSMQRVESEGYGKTFLLTTPFGKVLPAPSLECAETAMFLRITFASWYNLPFFLEARDRSGKRLYFGHFGMRTADGRYGRTPRFRDFYTDHSEKADSFRNGEIDWPIDEKLASRKLAGTFDDGQPMIGPDAHLGAYLDEIYLNKRTGYFVMLTLLYFGSVNLADPVNMFNIAASEVEAGDVLLERWQARGIGHTLVVFRSTDLGDREVDGVMIPQVEAELVSGSMPRRQPRWDSPAASKRYFTDETTGGPEHVALGGGIKRWRAATNIGGRWVNKVIGIHEDDYINSRDHETLGARPERFDEVLTELSPEEKIGALVEIIESKRQHLSQYPSSCSARIARERTFDELYKAGKEAFNWEPIDVDRRYRKLEDYVFAELEYEKSKTCCWNSSTSDMFEIVMQKAHQDVADPETGECREVTVFMNYDDDGDGFEIFRAYASRIDRGDQWVEWRADESCAQGDVAQDTEAEHAWAPLCEVAKDIIEVDEPEVDQD